MNEPTTPAWVYDDALVLDTKEVSTFNYSFADHHENIFINLAIPLLGFFLTVKKLQECPELAAVYQQICDEIRAIKMDLLKANIEPAIVNAYLYILCTFLDEAVLSTAWGASSIWSEHSLLVRFHNETWGGEKVFLILARLEAQSHKQLPLLQFIYQCLVLGFKGQYQIIENGESELEQIIKRLRDTLYPTPTEQPLLSAKRTPNIKQFIGRQWPVWSVLLGFIILWCVIFSVYSYLLDNKTENLLQQLERIL